MTLIDWLLKTKKRLVLKRGAQARKGVKVNLKPTCRLVPFPGGLAGQRQFGLGLPDSFCGASC
jgi:hypothetical protein